MSAVLFYLAEILGGDSPTVNIVIHRRTGNFLPGGAVNHLPKKIFQVAQIFTKESKRNEGHITTT